jgi:hypothetical protein
VKRKILVIVTVTVIAILVASFFVYTQINALQNQISELQTQNSELQDQNTDLQNKLYLARYVRITDFKWFGGINHVAGGTLAFPVEVTVENTGVNDVSGLTLTVKVVYVGNETMAAWHPYVEQIEVIHAGEVLKLSGDIWAQMGSFSKDSAVGVITPMLSDFVFDEWTQTLETVY